MSCLVVAEIVKDEVARLKFKLKIRANASENNFCEKLRSPALVIDAEEHLFKLREIVESLCTDEVEWLNLKIDTRFRVVRKRSIERPCFSIRSRICN